VLFGVALLALLVGLLIHRRFFHDDAYISLRYAERLLVAFSCGSRFRPLGPDPTILG
jgi:hypothetical protein